MLVLLLMFDEHRRKSLAEACREVSRDVVCVESADHIGAALAISPDRVDVVVLDPQLLQRDGAAHLVDWWSKVRRGELIVLGADPDSDLQRVRPVLLQSVHGSTCRKDS